MDVQRMVLLLSLPGLLLTGCHEPETEKAQDPAVSDASSLPADLSEILQVDQVLAHADELTGRIITVQGDTPQAIIGDEDGIPISFFYRKGADIQPDNRILIEIPDNTPGMSTVTICGRLEEGNSGLILRDTELVSVDGPRD